MMRTMIMNRRPWARLWLCSSLLLCIGSGCPAKPTLDEVLEEFARLRNEEKTVSCACPETVGTGNGTFATEQECLDAAGSIENGNLACMKQVLEGAQHDEAKNIALIECYNAAIEDAMECKRANIGTCSVSVSNQCVESRSAAFEVCDVSYSNESIEALFTCTLP